MKADINANGDCLVRQAYMETTCYACGFWGCCQAEIIDGCMKLDKDDKAGKIPHDSYIQNTQNEGRNGH